MANQAIRASAGGMFLGTLASQSQYSVMLGDRLSVESL